MNISKSKLGLLILGVIVLAEVGLCGYLAAIGLAVPEQAWSLLYATLGVLAGVAGAQAWNGKVSS